MACFVDVLVANLPNTRTATKTKVERLY